MTLCDAAAEDLSLLPIEPAVAAQAGHTAATRTEVAGPAVRLLRRAEPERPAHRGPGWFDSSFDLHRGCEVREGWPGDAGLREWIEGWLYGAAGGGASLSAT